MRTHPERLIVPPGLWEHEAVRQALMSRNVGVLFRHFRRYTGASQTIVGARVGLAQSDVSEIERGVRVVRSVDVLTRVAVGLEIPAALLGLAAPVQSCSVARVAASEREDDVRRRDLMAGALGLGAGLSVGTGTSAAADSAGGDPSAAMERALFEPLDAPPARLDDLHTLLASAQGDFTGAHYAALGGALPVLIATAEATRDASSGRARERAQAVVARAYVLATELAVKQHSEVAWATADRALIAARASGDPKPLAEAARVLAITMRRAGRGRGAVDLLARTASSLETERGTPVAQTLAARVCLLLTAAYTAASGHLRGTALDLLEEAEEFAERLPAGGAPAGLLTVAASPAECAMYRISTFNALGTPDEGVPYAGRVVIGQLASTERRARFATDTARMWHQLGDGPRAFAALRAIERTAPEEARRPAIRTLTLDLLYSPHSLPGLRAFATRTGALAAGWDRSTPTTDSAVRRRGRWRWGCACHEEFLVMVQPPSTGIEAPVM
ncbi:helix-turn-helix domain-containing protein [Streptomyces sp. SBT349]|uniref:helix-turn-helix domain-containing protein n=1 Tax=Streptomyces sp. SBT349 TaxID=1580539 RepID=UPI0007C746E2|nr:helix-turn-helix transcriptional regulator [Streptomyces sp. SBT349]